VLLEQGQWPRRGPLYPEPLVPSGENNRRVIQSCRPPNLVALQGVNCFSNEDNGLVEVFHPPKLLAPGEETRCKVVQRQNPYRVPL